MCGSCWAALKYFLFFLEPLRVVLGHFSKWKFMGIMNSDTCYENFIVSDTCYENFIVSWGENWYNESLKRYENLKR
jgi:hypothetical protein